MKVHSLFSDDEKESRPRLTRDHFEEAHYRYNYRDSVQLDSYIMAAETIVMGFKRLLKQCDKETITTAISKAMKKLRKKDPELLALRAHERAVTHRLAYHLEQTNGFPDWHIDCEYNRIGDKPITPKRIFLDPFQIQLDQQVYLIKDRSGDVIHGEDGLPRYAIEEARGKGSPIMPDIIVHRRGTPSLSLLIVEVKMFWNNDDHSYDLNKVLAYTGRLGQQEFRYRFGVFLLIQEDGWAKMTLWQPESDEPIEMTV